jgi:hypothetical protein
MRCIERLKFLRGERQRKRYGILLYMRRRAGLRNCDDATAADGPSQPDGGRRAELPSPSGE